MCYSTVVPSIIDTDTTKKNILAHFDVIYCNTIKNFLFWPLCYTIDGQIKWVSIAVLCTIQVHFVQKVDNVDKTQLGFLLCSPQSLQLNMATYLQDIISFVTMSVWSKVMRACGVFSNRKAALIPGSRNVSEICGILQWFEKLLNVSTFELYNAIGPLVS